MISRRLGQVVHEEVVCWAFLLSILNDANAACTNHLLGVAFSINLAQTSPFPKNFVVFDIDQVDPFLEAQTLDQLLISGLIARTRQEAHLGSAGIHMLGNLVQATDNTINGQSILEHPL